MATIYARGGRYYLNWREDGCQYRRSLGAIDRKAAEAIRAEKEAELRGLITPTRGVTVGAILTEYMTWYESARASTYRRALSALRRFRERFDSRSAEHLPHSLIDQWIAEQTATGQTEKALKLAKAAFRRAILRRQIAFNPMDGVSIPKPMTSRAPDYYRPDELAKLERQPHGTIWAFMVNTGIRRGEMVKARASDIRDGKLYVESSATGRTKNLRWRAVELNADANRARKRLGSDRLVECHVDTLGDWFAAEARACGLRGSLHWLRHTFCTALVQSGHSLHEVMRLAGHSSIAVTEQYAHHAPGAGKAAVASISTWRKPKISTVRKRRKAGTRIKPSRPRSSVG